MTDKKQPEALRLANALEYCDASVARQAINELRLLHAELEALRAGYAAARLDIETLKAQLAAQQPGVAYAALPEPITYQIAALKACEHGDALVGWRVEPSRQSFDASMRPKRKLYTEGDMHDFADRTHALRASHGQAPAQAVPAAVAGPSRDLHPEKCPVTGRPFFMTLDHPELGDVPTYGGPYDSYTIPAPEGEPTDPWHERELRSERYDHDAGWWVEGGEPIPLRIVHEDVLFKLQEDAEAAAPTTQPAPQQEAQEPCPSCRNSDIYACTCTFPKSRNTAPQPSPAAQGDVPESEYRRGYRHGYEQRDAEVRGALV